MIVSEAIVLGVLGLVAGTLIGSLLSLMLVKVLTGVFDPPPSAIAVPWAYLSAVFVITVAAFAVASAAAIQAARRPPITILREL
jgi:putative ABC transport system permease protein